MTLGNQGKKTGWPFTYELGIALDKLLQGRESHQAEDVGVRGSCLVSSLTQASQEGRVWSSWELRDQGTPELPLCPLEQKPSVFFQNPEASCLRRKRWVGEAWLRLRLQGDRDEKEALQKPVFSREVWPKSLSPSPGSTPSLVPGSTSVARASPGLSLQYH